MSQAANSKKTLRDWLAEGETLYNEAMKEYRALEGQLQKVEQQLAAKRAELNQMAAMLGKSSVDGPQRIEAELIESDRQQAMGPMARALSGKPT